MYCEQERSGLTQSVSTSNTCTHLYPGKWPGDICLKRLLISLADIIIVLWTRKNACMCIHIHTMGKWPADIAKKVSNISSRHYYYYVVNKKEADWGVSSQKEAKWEASDWSLPGLSSGSPSSSSPPTSSWRGGAGWRWGWWWRGGWAASACEYAVKTRNYGLSSPYNLLLQDRFTLEEVKWLTMGIQTATYIV